MTIHIVGLGPGNAQYLTRQAEAELREAKNLVLRTGQHGVAKWLQEHGIAFQTLDQLYYEADDFESLEQAAAQRLLALAEADDLTYGVPGHGLLGDGTVEALLRIPGNARVVFTPGLPDGFDSLATAGFLAGTAAAGVLAICPAALAAETHFDGTVPLLITQLNSPLEAGEAKETLAETWGDEASVVLLAENKATPISLFELDRMPGIDHTAALLLSPKDPVHARYAYPDLLDIMAKLRDECPWDHKQTHESLARYMLEEAYEATDAIERSAMDDLCSELGDVLLQVVFHAQIASQRGDFNHRDVTHAICSKMISRHPHVFAQGDAQTADDVLERWDEIKKKERAQTQESESMLAVAAGLPSLMRAEKLQACAGRAGWFQRSNAKDSTKELREKMKKLTEEITEKPNPERLENALGDVLFAAVDAARVLKIEPELALRKACEKFIRRFGFVERATQQTGRRLEEISLDEQAALWDQARATEAE